MFFLSYSSRRRRECELVAKALEERGVVLWWDGQRGAVEEGAWIVGRLEDKLNDSSGLLVLVDARGVDGWVRLEVGAAIYRSVCSKGFRLVPLLLDGITWRQLPPFLQQFRSVSLPATLDGDHEFFDELAESLGGSPATVSVEWSSERSPFPGPRSFEEADADIFFGREQEVLDAVNRLGGGVRWLQIQGASGVGKSSFAKAGVIPMARTGWLPSDAPIERVLMLRPRNRALRNLALELRKQYPERERRSAQELFEQLRGDEDFQGPGDVLATMVSELQDDSPGGVLLFIDQMEELATHDASVGGESLSPDAEQRWAEARRLAQLLDEALGDRSCKLWVVSTIRSDLVHRVDAALPRISQTLNRLGFRYGLGPMTREGLRQAVVRPAMYAGLQWSDDRLASDIVDEVVDRKAATVLLAEALRALWDERDGSKLMRKRYKLLGGVAGALATRASGVMKTFGSAKESRAAREILLGLVQPVAGGSFVRRMLTREDAVAIAEDIGLSTAVGERVLQRLSGLAVDGRADDDRPPARIVDVSGEEPYYVELIHEALTQQWPAVVVEEDNSSTTSGEAAEGLRTWLEQPGTIKRLRLREAFERIASLWDEAGRPESQLEGQTAARWKGVSPVSAAGRVFWRQILERDSKRRRRRFVIAAVATTLVATVGLMSNWWLGERRALLDDIETANDFEALSKARDEAQESIFAGGATRAAYEKRFDELLQPKLMKLRSSDYAEARALREEVVQYAPVEAQLAYAGVVEGQADRALVRGEHDLALLLRVEQLDAAESASALDADVTTEEAVTNIRKQIGRQLSTRADSEIALLHPRSVADIALIDDGRFVSTYSDNTLRIWDASEPELKLLGVIKIDIGSSVSLRDVQTLDGGRYWFIPIRDELHYSWSLFARGNDGKIEKLPGDEQLKQSSIGCSPVGKSCLIRRLVKRQYEPIRREFRLAFVSRNDRKSELEFGPIMEVDDSFAAEEPPRVYWSPDGTSVALKSVYEIIFVNQKTGKHTRRGGTMWDGYEPTPAVTRLRGDQLEVLGWDGEVLGTIDGVSRLTGVSATGPYLSVLHEGRASIHNIDGVEVLSRANAEVLFDMFGNRAAVLDEDGLLEVWDLDRGEIEARYEVPLKRAERESSLHRWEWSDRGVTPIAFAGTSSEDFLVFHIADDMSSFRRAVDTLLIKLGQESEAVVLDDIIGEFDRPIGHGEWLIPQGSGSFGTVLNLGHRALMNTMSMMYDPATPNAIRGSYTSLGGWHIDCQYDDGISCGERQYDPSTFIRNNHARHGGGYVDTLQARDTSFSRVVRVARGRLDEESAYRDRQESVAMAGHPSSRAVSVGDGELVLLDRPGDAESKIDRWKRSAVSCERCRRGLPRGIRSIDVSGSISVVQVDDGAAVRIDTVKGAIVEPVIEPPVGSEFREFAASPTGKFFIVVDDEGGIAIWPSEGDVATRVEDLDVTGSVSFVAVTDSGQCWAVATTVGWMTGKLWTECPHGSIRLDTDVGGPIQIVDEGRYIVAGGEDTKIYSPDGEGGAVQICPRPARTAVRFLPGGGTFVERYRSELMLRHVGTCAAVSSIAIGQSERSQRRPWSTEPWFEEEYLEVTEDGSAFAIASRGWMHFFSVDSNELRPTGSAPLPGEPVILRLLDSGRAELVYRRKGTSLEYAIVEASVADETPISGTVKEIHTDVRRRLGLQLGIDGELNPIPYIEQ